MPPVNGMENVDLKAFVSKALANWRAREDEEFPEFVGSTQKKYWNKLGETPEAKQQREWKFYVWLVQGAIIGGLFYVLGRILDIIYWTGLGVSHLPERTLTALAAATAVNVLVIFKPIADSAFGVLRDIYQRALRRKEEDSFHSGVLRDIYQRAPSRKEEGSSQNS